MRFDKRPSKKSKSGYTWRVTFEYKDPYGLTKRHSKSGFITKKEAQIYAIDAQRQLDKGIDPKARSKTVDDVFEEWKAVTKLRPSTIITYSNSYQNHVSPVIGTVPISQIHYPQLQQLFSSLAECGTSCVWNTRKVVAAIGKLAIKSGYIESWPIDLVEISSKDNKRKRNEFLSKIDFDKLATALLDTRISFHGGYRVMSLYLGYYAGLRISECCGLLWDDVDFEKRTITVQHQLSSSLSMESSSPEISSILKSDSSYGSIPIPEPLYQALVKWKEYNPYDVVICSIEGKLIRPSSIRNQIRPKAAAIGIDYHPHMLRHTFVTNLLLSGADLKTVSTLARHKDVKVTLQIYAEVVGDSKEEAIKKAFENDEISPEILA